MGFKIEKEISSTRPSRNSPCAELRAAYHECFNRWYSDKFLKGQWDKEECVTEWEKYRECISHHLEDKQLSRFLEPGTAIPASVSSDRSKSESPKSQA